MNKIRVLIADDHAIVRSGVNMLLSSQPDIVVVGEASDGREAVQKALELQPDVVMMDLSMPPGLDGIAATTELKKEAPDIHVLVLTMYDDEEYLFRVLNAGASGYIIKNAHDSELVAAVRAVYEGQAYLYPTAAKRLVESFLHRVEEGENVDIYHLLTDREREVLTLIAKGYGNKEMAEQLFISVKTVESHKARVMNKLGLYTRHELVDYAIRKGLLDLEYSREGTIS
ncbi:response regulator [Numidum massiliense]|uniref:response regulator n=1 Tax=Numidum massiliense TaxID=1522315 RepID=UPI000A460A37|nr:response regulator transcription factor [Numidum massiliense]